MGAVFAKVIPSIIALEGDQYSNDPHDYGGETKYGISKREFPNEDIPNLSESRAMTLLEENYWQRYRLSEINDQAIANQIFFLLINMNPLNAGKIVQTAINACGRGLINIKIDGILGSKSMEAINSLMAYWLNDRIRVESCRYYLRLTDDDKSQLGNFRGWIRRALV
jgi:lysozyme family protein